MHTWKYTAERGQNNATNVTLHPHRKLVEGHILLHIEKSTKCNQCAYASTKKDSLKIHGGETWNKYASLHAYNLRVILKKHNTENLYKCKHCDFALSGPSTLRSLLETNSGQNTNRCNQCKYASYQTGILRTHMKTHSGEKLNQCNQFNYISSDPSTLRTYLKRHSEVKSNKCNQCNFSSTWPTGCFTKSTFQKK